MNFMLTSKGLIYSQVIIWEFRFCLFIRFCFINVFVPSYKLIANALKHHYTNDAQASKTVD